MADDRNVDVIDLEGKKAGSVVLPGSTFDVPTNIPLMHQVVVAQLAAARQGTHATKTRGVGGNRAETRGNALLELHALELEAVLGLTAGTAAQGVLDRQVEHERCV